MALFALLDRSIYITSHARKYCWYLYLCFCLSFSLARQFTFAPPISGILAADLAEHGSLLLRQPGGLFSLQASPFRHA